MDRGTRKALGILLIIVVVLLLLIGAGVMTGTMTSGGMMGVAGMGGFGWMWLPISVVAVLGVVLAAAIFGKK